MTQFSTANTLLLFELDFCILCNFIEVNFKKYVCEWVQYESLSNLILPQVNIQFNIQTWSQVNQYNLTIQNDLKKS